MMESKNKILPLLGIFTFAFCAIVYVNSSLNKVSATEISICPGIGVQCTVILDDVTITSERGKNNGQIETSFK